MAHTLGEKPNIRPYIMVFVALMALTLITVAVSYLHLPTPQAIALALLIATVKASLVACYFMHLMTERKLILWALLLSALLFAFVLVIPTITAGNPITL
jgi:cytochrome c oxidase subunit 4